MLRPDTSPNRCRKIQWPRLSSANAGSWCKCGLTKKAEPPPTCDVNRDSDHSSRSERFLWGHQFVAALGTPTASANGGWLRRLVRRQRVYETFVKHKKAQLGLRPIGFRKTLPAVNVQNASPLEHGQDWLYFRVKGSHGMQLTLGRAAYSLRSRLVEMTN